MSTVNVSTSPLVASNPRGIVVIEGATISLSFVVIFVCLRIWGRYRYKTSPGSSAPSFGEPRFWMMVSDLAILASSVVAVVLTVIACVGVKWGLGLHAKLLRSTQLETTLQMFYLYQIFYKFGAGLSKIATCLLLLAISTPQMKNFNRCCRIMIIYIAVYSISCSIVTAFQCGYNFKSNWIHGNDQSQCFYKPPFWFSHAGLNIFASIVVAGLPWWLFSFVTYKRKYTIAMIMTLLAISEIVLGCVRLDGLYTSTHSLNDISYGATTGILVSQLEVNFGIISACIPTVLKIMEDSIKPFFGFSFGSTTTETGVHSQSRSRNLGAMGSHLPTIDKSKPRSQYERFGDDDLEMDSINSGNSRENIIRDDKVLDLNIKIETFYTVERELDTKPENNERAAQHYPMSITLVNTEVTADFWASAAPEAPQMSIFNPGLEIMAQEPAAEVSQMDEKVSETSHGLAVSSPSRFDRKLVLKIDFYLLTPLLLLNFLSLMGRTNIGAAMVQGLPKDLKLDAMKVFLAITIPLVPLILFEVPSNLLMRFLERKYSFSYMRYMSIITALLGLVTLGQGFDKSYSALLATRFLVGIFDSGLIPGCIFVCALYYPAVHLQWRVSMVMVANIASNIVGNILAFGIAHIKSSNGYHGWRWIFIVEGCLTMAISFACFFCNISRPETASFLSDEQKEIIATEVEARTTTVGIAAEWKIFLSNGLNYIWAACYVLTCSTTYSVAIFSPSFVQAFHPHYTTPQVQGQVVPIFIVSGIVCLLAAWAADRINHRAGFAIAGYLVTAIGFIILRQPKILAPRISMLGLYFVSMGTFTSLPLLYSLPMINSATPFQRAIGAGFVIGIGNVGGFVSAWLFRTSEAPHYRNGMTTSLIMTLVALGLMAFAWVYITNANKRSDKNATTTDTGSAIDSKDSPVVRRYRA
ncbi:hypothetical protein SBOR_3537 [Sclerotinia borealis F-4128]|uniref:Major facilitator superfamily (MFS) profile domain-containing protein n=1 Tax=Sclerotinia borealis (strain F-4128) TaxID=1432307 RepID=W9CNH0_SCLBF|nr:hypothetical protein SBOR_3537 [Sclerotinia borealis F-4128]